MKKTQNIREIALDIMPQVANFGFWLRDQHVVSPIAEISCIPENVHFPSRNPSDTRHSICGKMETHKLPNVPLYTRTVPLLLAHLGSMPSSPIAFVVLHILHILLYQNQRVVPEVKKLNICEILDGLEGNVCEVVDEDRRTRELILEIRNLL